MATPLHFTPLHLTPLHLTPLHLTLGDHAAALLRAAARAHGLAGDIVPIPDDLSHGPLHNGPARLAYFRACYQGFADWSFVRTDAFAPWHELLTDLDKTPASEIVVWAGDNGSEVTFLTMACAWLEPRPEPVSRASPPPGTYTGQLAPAQLATLYATRQPLDRPTRQTLAQDFARLCAENAAIRRWENGRVIGAPIDRYDNLLRRACPSTWTRATRLVATAMASCDPANLMSDLFFASRLQALITAGRIEADKPGTHLPDYAVRLPPPPG